MSCTYIGTKSIRYGKNHTPNSCKAKPLALLPAVKNSLDQGVGPYELKNAPFVIKLARIIERGKLNHIKLNRVILRHQDWSNDVISG